jgi:hypothetical protein
MVWAGLLEEPLKGVHRRPRLTLIFNTGATCLPLIVVIKVGRGHGPLKALLAPLLAALDTLLSTANGDIERHLLATAWGRLPASLGKTKFGRLVAGGVLGGDAAQILSGVTKNVIVFALAWVPCTAFR